jgi:hypothetical protein
MPTTRTIQIFKFDELSGKAKNRARDWYRQSALDYDWWDAVYEDAIQCGILLGIEIGTKKTGKRDSHAIYFSGFSSQGDGACFDGTWSAELPAGFKSFEDAIKSHAPTDETLHGIARDLDAVRTATIEEGGREPCARTKQSGRYSNSGCMEITTNIVGDISNATLDNAVRSFADWIYKQLNAEHDHLTSDEAVDESIIANDYEFNETGSRT